MEKEKIILDVDTGTDDAVAIILALLCKDMDLMGICSVNGNVELRLTTDNTLRVVDFCGKGDRVPVIRGCDLPMVSTLLPWTPQSTGIMTAHTKGDVRQIPRREGMRSSALEMHGEHLDLPETDLQPIEESAVVWLIKTLLAAKDHSVTLVPVGPLTNIGVALRADPRIVHKIKRVVLMGGGYQVNSRTPAAEFNIWADPEAAEILLQSGCDITFVPLDATHAAYITAEEAQQLRKIGTKEAEFVAATIEGRIRGYVNRDKDMSQFNGAPVHDALAICAVVLPEVLKDVIPCNCHVDISGGYAYGQTILDRRAYKNGEPINCKFALNADRDMFFRWMKGILEDAAREL